MSDQQLFKDLKSGSEEAFSILFERYRYRVFIALFFFRKENEEKAKEITAKVFVWLWEHKESIPEHLPHTSNYLIQEVLPKVYKRRLFNL
jgi:hypothetical protein